MCVVDSYHPASVLYTVSLVGHRLTTEYITSHTSVRVSRNQLCQQLRVSLRMLKTKLLIEVLHGLCLKCCLLLWCPSQTLRSEDRNKSVYMKL